jgi:hypothetical protein
VESPVETPGEIQVSDQQLETYERIEHIKERYGDDATGRAQIQRRLKDGRLIGLPSIPALTFDTDLVAKRYGGGRYYVRFYQGRQYMGDIEFELDESLQPEPEVVAVPVTVSSSSGEAPSWLAATLDKIGDAVKAMADRPAPTPPVPPDPIAMIEKLASTMRSLAPPAPVAVPAPDLKDQLALVESIVNVGTKVIGARGDDGGGSGDSYMGVVTELAKPVIELVKTQAERERLKQGRRMAALPAVTGPISVPVTSGGTPTMPWLMEVQRWLPLIQKRQQKGLDAESTAFFVLDELSEGTLATLAELAAQDDFETQVQKLLPAEMLTNAAWVADFLQAVKDYLFEDEQVAGEHPGGADVPDLDAEAERRLARLPSGDPEPPPAQGL